MNKSFWNLNAQDYYNTSSFNVPSPVFYGKSCFLFDNIIITYGMPVSSSYYILLGIIDISCTTWTCALFLLRFSLMFISIFVVIQPRGSPSLPTVALHGLLTWMCSATREDLNLQIINVGQSALIGSSRESLQRQMKASSSWKTQGWEVLMMFFCSSTPPSLISREEGPRRSKLLNVDDGEAASLRLLDFLERSNSLRRRCFSRYHCQKGSGLTSRKPEAEYWAQSLPMPLIRGERDVRESSVADLGCSGTNTAE